MSNQTVVYTHNLLQIENWTRKKKILPVIISLTTWVSTHTYTINPVTIDQFPSSAQIKIHLHSNQD